MTLRYLRGASLVTVLACGLTVVAPASAQNADLLPRGQHAVITVSGCLQLGGKDHDKFILANPRLGPVANVTEGTCSAAIDSRALDLDDADDRGINETLVGRWVEVSGRLEREMSTDPTNLRELSVRSFRLIPVVPPQRAEAPAPVPAAEFPAAIPSPVLPAPTAFEQPLPTTASPFAMIGLLGLLSLAGGAGFRIYRARARG